MDDQDEIVGDENGDGLVNSADTGVVGDTNGDGTVDDADNGVVGDTNGEPALCLFHVLLLSPHFALLMSYCSVSCLSRSLSPTLLSL